VVFVGVNVPWDKDQLARMFVAVYKVPYQVGRDVSGAVAGLYNVEATPTTFFIGKDGKVLDRVVGELEESDVTRRIEALLK
jgi:cytochrome c biogenesis protein CcmG, thiol:disulfide interchange protein DsbE